MKKKFFTSIAVTFVMAAALVAVAPTNAQAAKAINVKVGEKTTVKASKKVTWSIKDTSIATLNKKSGKKVKLTGVKEGSTILTTTDASGKKLDYAVNVKAAAAPAASNKLQEFANYVKSKNRAISLMLVSESPLTDILIDDVAVSKQKIKTSQFGKYDFMTGSSQASPFVAGAAALVHNAHPELNAMDVINTLKSSAKQSESLNNYAEGGRFLDLESVDEHAIAAYVPVSGVSLNTTALTLSVGNKYTLRATVTPSNATDKAVVWSTSDESVAAVSADGVVTAKKTGAAVITAKTGDGLSASCKVTAIIPVSGIKLNYSALTMTAGTKFTLKATVTPSDATNKTVYWSSSSPSVAGMAAGGVINAKKAGTTTVTAKTSNGKAATCKITVKPAPAPTGIKLGTTSLTMTAGTKYTLKATVLPSTANNKTVYWSSSNTSVAGMAAGGVINAKKAGSCTITAKTANGKKATCKLTVKPKSNTVFVTGIKLNASKLTMTAGTKYTLKATITPSNATNKNVMQHTGFCLGDGDTVEAGSAESASFTASVSWADAAAVGGATASLVNLLVGFFIGLASGATVIISQFYGAGQEKDVSRAVHTSAAMALLFGLILSAGGFALSPWLLSIMDTPQDVLPYAVTYIRIIFLGMIPSLVYNIGSGVLRAVGDSRRPLYFLIVSCLTNIVLDVVLVLGFEMGVAGAALATILSQAVSASLVVITLMRSPHPLPMGRIPSLSRSTHRKSFLCTRMRATPTPSVRWIWLPA